MYFKKLSWVTGNPSPLRPFSLPGMYQLSWRREEKRKRAGEIILFWLFTFSIPALLSFFPMVWRLDATSDTMHVINSLQYAILSQPRVLYSRALLTPCHKLTKPCYLNNLMVLYSHHALWVKDYITSTHTWQLLLIDYFSEEVSSLKSAIFNFSLGLDSRVKMISGLIIRGSYTRIFAMATDDRCHVVSEDGLTWSCIMPEEWQHESSSNDFVHAIFVPRNLKSNLPEGEYIASKSDGTIFYGGNLTD